MLSTEETKDIENEVKSFTEDDIWKQIMGEPKD